MTDKITLNTLASIQNDPTAVALINANSAAIVAGMDNTLSRDGTAPNQMQSDLDMNGFAILNTSVVSPETLPGILRYTLTGVNFNSANTDNAIVLALPSGVSRWRANICFISNASASISTATAGLFTSTGGSGTIAANQAITVTQTAANTNNNCMSFSLTNPNTTSYTSSTVYFRVGTAQGTAATADVVFDINILT